MALAAWVVPSAIIVAIEYAFALALGIHVGFRYELPFTTYLILGLFAAFVGIVAIILFKLVRFALQREESPARRLARESTIMASFAIGAIVIALQMAVLSWTKIMLPIASSFWADPLLANLDDMLFRAEPWQLANSIFGPAVGLIDRAYVTWAPFKFATTIFLLLAPESTAKSRAIVAYFLMMSITAIGQYALPSAGPIFYADLGFGPRFEHLTLQPWVETTKQYLWHDYLHAGGDIGGGISAMPSLHVAAAAWIALVWNAFGRRLGLLGFAYLAVIYIGSVILGWHYAVDGIAGILITAAAWKIAPVLSRRIQRPATRFSVASAG
jgi:hypothetical protein